MASSIAWLSHDTAERDRTLKLLEYFKDEGTVDDLGVGTIRDAFANALFPGTSVIQTRARYFLFLPWLLAETARNGKRGIPATEDLRRNEIRLIHALLEGRASDGVIGQSAKGKLKRMPSAVYWAGLRHYGIRTTDVTIGGFFREASAAAERSRRRPDADDDGLAVRETLPGMDPELAVSCPPPECWLRSTTLDLAPAEASYLQDRIVGSTRGSLLSWLLANSRRADVGQIWHHPDLPEFPEHLKVLVEHAERFHRAIYGGFLLYNLLLAEKKQSHDLIDKYRERITEWHEEIADHGVWVGWTRAEFWGALRSSKPTLRDRTVTFVDAWLDGASRSEDIADDVSLRNLVVGREYELKRSRSRLINQARLDEWRGGSGLIRFDYRWGITSQVMADIFDGLDAPE